MEDYTSLSEINEKNGATIMFWGYEMEYKCDEDGYRGVRLDSSRFPPQVGTTYIIDALLDLKKKLGEPNRAYIYCSALDEYDEAHECEKEICVCEGDRIIRLESCIPWFEEGNGRRNKDRSGKKKCKNEVRNYEG